MTSAALPNRRALAAKLEAGLMRALKGRPLPDVTAWDPRRSEAAAAEAHGAWLRDLVVHERLLEGRVTRAVRAELDPLVLADGSTMEVEHAHKRLVEKEPRAPFVALRALLEERAEEDPPARLGRRFLEMRSKLQAAAPSGAASAPDPLDERLAVALVDALAPVLPALLDVLASEAGHPADDGHRLHRALTPAHPVFQRQGLGEVIGVLKEAVTPQMRRPARRALAPRSLRGALLLDEEGPRWLTGPTWRGPDFADGVAEGATVLLASLAPAPVADRGDRAWRALGRAASFALWRHPGLSRTEREHVDRLLRAALVVRLFAQAVLRQTLAAEGDEPDAWWEALHSRLGGTCPALLREGWRLGLPGALWPRGPGAALGVELATFCEAARLHRGLRDRLDEGWPLHPELLGLLDGVGGPARENELSGPLPALAALIGAEAELAAEEAAAQLVDWVSEMM